MVDELKEAEKAEIIQAVNALMIPLSLFLSCVTFAAGLFLIVNNEPFGWALIGLTVIVSIIAFVALIRFHNGYRAKGIIPESREIDGEIDDVHESVDNKTNGQATETLSSN
ncbi:MAG: hypothetical protein K8F91_00290 [Candidatus Obscuribacterales bacterium]|nr:hypothetical protein [Candidatus Obscuribacterales bacterium]